MLTHGLAQAFDVLNRPDEAEAAGRQALAWATDPAMSAEIAWHLTAHLYTSGRYADSLPIVDEALARPDLPPLWQPRLRAYRARALASLGRRDDAEAEAAEALAGGERLGDPVAIGYALNVRYLISPSRTGLGHVERALRVVGHAPETIPLRITLLTNQGESLEQLEDHDGADAAQREALVLAEQVGAWRLATVRVQIGQHYLLTGRWDDAWVELSESSGKFGHFERLTRLGCLAFIAAHRDDRGTCAELLREADELPELAGYMRGNATQLIMARAVDAEQRHGPAAAVAVLADTIAVEDIGDLFDRCLWLPDLVRLALAVGDLDLARATVATAEADLADEALPRRIAAAQQARAVLEGDVATLQSLTEQHRQRRAPLAAGQAYEELAVQLAQAQDSTGARGALTQAVATYRELGATWDARRADARLHVMGVRRSPTSARRRPTTGWDALTPTEDRIAGLVAQGRSNPDIADELLLSRRTVQTHVSHILTKLGYSSRIEIARAADRRTGTTQVQ